jgi:hypothetical protein
MEALQMLKFSVNKGRGLDFTAGMGKIVELDEMEDFEIAEGKIAEDIMAFIASLDEYEDV